MKRHFIDSIYSLTIHRGLQTHHFEIPVSRVSLRLIKFESRRACMGDRLCVSGTVDYHVQVVLMLIEVEEPSSNSRFVCYNPLPASTLGNGENTTILSTAEDCLLGLVSVKLYYLKK